jgi:phosphopantothenoylcysteine decarboxylase/phosphopantothenate--cysteine ligase
VAKKKKPLQDISILVTAGPTREFLDPVRFLSNPSSGKMGYALAREAVRLGANVTLISGPTSLTPPKCRFLRVISAADMDREAMKAFSKSRIVIMTAAVSDFTPVARSRHKVKKSKASLTLKLKPTVDILEKMGRKKKRGQILVGFAAETRDLGQNALKKLERKNLDLIVANDVKNRKIGFESDLNRVTLYFRKNPKPIPLPLMTKDKAASAILTLLRRSVTLS